MFTFPSAGGHTKVTGPRLAEGARPPGTTTIRLSGAHVHQLLPMFGQTHGNRSAVTCHLKCGSACAYAPPNDSTEPSFADIANTQLSRRSVLIGSGALAAAAALPTVLPPSQPRRPPQRGLKRPAVHPDRPGGMTVDAFVVPKGYQWTPILRWGDPLFSDSPAFNPAVPDAEAQERQFGYNNDYLDILVTDRRGRRALLCCNHEYTNRPIMFPPTASDAAEREVLKATMAATGFSVVELVRAGKGARGATFGTATSTGGSPPTRRSP